MNNYEKVATAIQYIKDHFREQPDLEKIAAAAHLSPFHFQRVFAEWAGVSPKKFLQYLTLDYAKSMLRQPDTSIMDAAFEAGLSGPSRLHDLFVNIESMTPGEFKNGGKALHINYSFAESPFGNMIVASTAKGICYMAFADDETAALAELHALFPAATFRQMTDMMQQNALFIFTHDWSRLSEIKLHLKATPFQIKVWEALLKVPMGNITTYSQLAEKIQHPKAARAVGSAVGSNPVAFLIPCHRVIKATGETGQYHWGDVRKSAMLGWEAANTHTEQ
ncbi:MAG: methylated-DNA--[protein]-cysteine S-methyltransferase [Chitinophaga sp.]|uniref:methylated-DNA--[protein]-cysteine S-methyltransferase n=1 Tax=Chitinophaga sp. TaxID=1869181 RepID=UPI0025C655FE|nr:methylated-DNA--[protein]-cysteine S-methyltransferase [Chitinophaga sp.]MBV8255601.1 methylated-DNA--[protein]-cysteine S-methyltransferase [Chitinophaga sp.]